MRDSSVIFIMAEKRIPLFLMGVSYFFLIVLAQIPTTSFWLMIYILYVVSQYEADGHVETCLLSSCHCEQVQQNNTISKSGSWLFPYNIIQPSENYMRFTEKIPVNGTTYFYVVDLTK